MIDASVQLAGVTSPILLWIPFMEPAGIPFSYLVLLLPLVLAVSYAYKAIKIEHVDGLAREGLVLSGQILFFMALAAAALWMMTDLW
ncbi:MAG: hypothetical protein JJU36_05960 [Phycisphaeraceae bacterium]|nr:hypothetical protein [Phycisphaeraceae bacterium]